MTHLTISFGHHPIPDGKTTPSTLSAPREPMSALSMIRKPRHTPVDFGMSAREFANREMSRIIEHGIAPFHLHFSFGGAIAFLSL
jgi:hypothetical protein